jgi:protein-tyrosine phosphatase
MLFETVLWTCFIGVVGYLFDRHLKWYLFPKRWGVVEAGSIFRSGQLSSPQIKKQIKKHQINVIISLMSPVLGDSNYEAEQNAIRNYGLAYYTYPLLGDGTGDIEQYAAAIAKIHESTHEKKTVLVHCAAGTQRTGGVIASYRILVQGKPPRQAVLEMKQYGWRHRRNPTLIPFINEHLAELQDLLIRKNIVDRSHEALPVLTSKT